MIYIYIYTYFTKPGIWNLEPWQNLGGFKCGAFVQPSPFVHLQRYRNVIPPKALRYSSIWLEG